MCFCGPDGAGKTTIIRLLYLYYRRLGLRVHYVWMRGTHTVASLLARLLVRFSTFRGSDIPHYNLHVPWYMRKFWALLEAISAILYIIPRLAKSLITGKSLVLFDRCLLDTAVWICSTLGHSNLARSFPIRLLIALNKKLFKCTVYVTAQMQVLFRRKREYPCRFILSQVALYNTLAKYLGYAVVDTSEDTVTRSVAKVLDILEKINLN